MIHLYKKVEKTRENPFGVIEITKPEELTKPFLLCISAQDSVDKSVYGIIKEGAQAARVYTTEEDALGYKIDEFPIDFLGIDYKKEKEEDEKYKELVDQYIFPIIISNGGRNIDIAIRNARKINVMTYCDGTKVFVEMEKYLKQRLSSMGYSEEDIKRIVSNISLVAIGTMVDTSELDSTTVRFIDINDDEIMDENTDRYHEVLDEKEYNSYFEKKNNSTTFFFRGTGEHRLKEYLEGESSVKPVLCSIVAYFLQKSYKNTLEPGVTISPEEVVGEMDKYSSDLFKPEKMLELVESRISYGDAPKYTESELKLRKDLDISLRELAITKSELERKTKEKDVFESKVRGLVEQIRECSSETTFYQIMGNLKMWNTPAGFNSDQPTDKEIRAAYEEMIKQEKSVPKF